jgi:BirA family biotin operon repressor/biotin-[acetyl-CoA-carboxylase] ligase
MTGIATDSGSPTLSLHNQLQTLLPLADGSTQPAEALPALLGLPADDVGPALRAAADGLGLALHTEADGWRLGAPLELLDARTIAEALPADVQPLLGPVEVLAEVDSTNTRLMQQAREGAPSGSVCLAERQLAGRGRRGRPWVSPFGVNLYLSMLWRASGGPATLAGLSLAAGVAIAEALETFGAGRLGLKWPNDVHWQGRKLAGLLIEVGGEPSGPSFAVLGVGVNLRMKAGSAVESDTAVQTIGQPWCDLDQVLAGQVFDRSRLAAVVIGRLLRMLARFRRDGLAPFLDGWRRRDTTLGLPVAVELGGGRLLGTGHGIDNDGALLLKVPDGAVYPISAGEVSLRVDLRS